jgi:alanine racemase
MTTRPTRAEIDTQALEDNYRILRSLAPAGSECVAIVKADAYGHAVDLCAPAALRAGAQWLGVATMEEAVSARSVAPHARILAIGGVFPGEGTTVIRQNITPSIWTAQHINELESAAHAASLAPASLPVHLEIDTGMSRQGANLDELPNLLARFTPTSPLRVEAVMTHLYASDESDHIKSAAQLTRLQQALQLIQSTPAATHLQYLSAGASAALLGADAAAITTLAAQYKLTPMLRLGLALYGVTPRIFPAHESATPALKPVFTWKTSIASLRTVPAGTEIGYNGTFTATEPMRLALIPVGYADGLNRKLGNRFSLLVRGEHAPLVGRVSMDTAVLDVTEIPEVKVGDEVVILGTQANETITAYDLADAMQTIPWEVFTRISPRVPRIPTTAPEPPQPHQP